MKQSKTLRRSLLCGLGVLSLAAVGCGGGGGGTLVSPTTLTINGGANASVGRTSKSVSKALGALAGTSATINAYTLDGTLIDSVTGVSLPYDFPVNSGLSSALQGASAVFKVIEGTNEYKTIVKVDASQIGSGPIKDTNGNELAELVGPGSTAVTELVALEMENTLGTPISLGEVSSPETVAAVKSLVAQDKPTVDPATLATSLKSSVNTAGSMVKAIVDAIRTQTGTVKPATFLRKPPASAKAIISKGRKFSKANARLSGAAKASKANGTLLKQLNKKLAALAASTTANADSASSGANMIANVVSMAGKTTGTAQTSLNTQLTALVADNVAITGAAAKAATDILPVLVDNATALEESGASADMAGMIGAVMQDDTIATNSGVSGVFDSLLQVVKDPTAFAGEAIKTASDTPAGASRVVKQVAATSQTLAGTLDFSAAVKDVAKEAGSDMVVALATVIKDLPAATTTALFNGDTTAGVNSFVGALTDTLSGDALSDVVASASDIGFTATIADAAKIAGPTSAKSGSKFVLYNNSIAIGDVTSYTYAWTVTPAVADTVTSDDSVTFTATSTTGYSVKLEQTKGSTITTATHSVSVAAKLMPVVTLTKNTLDIAQSKSGAIDVTVFDPEGRTITTEATVVGTGLTVTTLGATGGTLKVTAASTALAKSYIVNIAVKEGSTTLYTKQLTVNVKALADTKVFLSGVMDKTAGDSITIKAVSVQEKTLAGAGTLELIVTNSNSTTPNATAVLAVGNSNVSATVSSLATGAYTVTVNAKDGNTVLKTFSSAFNVKPVGAPTFSKLNVASTNVLEFPNIELVGATTTTSVVIDATAAVSGTTATVAYTLQVGATAALAAAANATAVTTQTVGVGDHYFVLTATANGKAVKKAFKVSYSQVKKLVVSSVAMGGNVPNVTQGNLANSVASNEYVMNASNIQNLTLNTNDTMYLDVMAGTGTTALAGGEYNFEVSLTDAASSRNATLRVVNATITGDSTAGFDVTTAASLDFAGTKANGTSATIAVPVETVITNFTPLFSAVQGGMRIDLIALRNSMEQVLTGNSFASSLRNLNGTNLTVTIKVSGVNFSMTNSAGTKFDTFKAVNVKVN
ncbi:MAG: hypothetical protein KC646_07805 [Candidatus Cloacimonetes bacterium]|nr:hypothetical protein [Candidatus Cloacimonadota bacterium]